MKTGLEARTALITGAGRGIGAFIADALHREGAKVVLVDLDGDAVKRAARTLDPSGTTAIGTAADVSRRSEFGLAFDRAVACFGRVDVLVNNAARTDVRSFWEIDDDEWDAVLAVNLRSVFIGCQLAGPHMRANRFGRIINLASLAGQQGGTLAGAHYAASKAGILAVTKVVARDLASHGVTVNAIAPAAIRTPVVDELPPERIAALAAEIPVGRPGEPREVGELAVYLASDAASFVTGATLDINGGLFMR